MELFTYNTVLNRNDEGQPHLDPSNADSIIRFIEYMHETAEADYQMRLKRRDPITPIQRADARAAAYHALLSILRDAAHLPTPTTTGKE